ncbi:GDSL-type esterase/lipase family protein [Bacillus benzoevorans]|uniref:Lysophospholipase L1-like esterase n=1 Tax=Bacillus benzoevorans TaxID=1456 RepID=A0A7X0HSD5_9BACI|nr:GDSL-type esterase/lipase family protein [Bacillus benzoevorans]MBB6444830.1 lysophospholipase L1-like esterase [Bacillus benzoevorans]
MKKYYFVMGIMLLLVILYTCRIIYSAGSNTIHLTAIGDSITYGTGDPGQKGYIGRVKELLQEEKGILVELSNFGVPRYTTDQILQQLQDRKIIREVKKADYIILYAGTNDFRKSAAYTLDSLKIQQMKTGKERYSQNLHRILDLIRLENTSAPILVLGLYHPYSEYQNEEEILNLIQQWNQEIEASAANYEMTYFVPVLDLYINQPKKDYFSDKIHLNPAGYQLMAERLYQKLILLQEGSDNI